MPVIGAAAVTAGGALAGALIGSHDASKARQAQQQSAATALDYEKGRNTIEDNRYNAKFKLYQDYLNDYRARHGGATTAGGGGGGAAPVNVSVADLVNSQQGAGKTDTGSVADMVNGGNGDVFDWKRYGA